MVACAPSTCLTIARLALRGDPGRSQINRLLGEAEGQLLSLGVFFIFGAVLLPEALAEPAWRSLGYALASLTVLRMVPVGISLLGSKVSGVTTLFLRWFGPRGLASILYLLMLLERYELPHRASITTATLLTVLGSIMLHGMSASSGAARYAAHMKGHGPAHRPIEHAPASRFPTRFRLR